METVYDWMTVAVFCAIVTLFLNRSMAEHEIAGDNLVNYLIPAVGCAFANYFGNEGWHLPAILTLATSVLYIFVMLKPFSKNSG